MENIPPISNWVLLAAGLSFMVVEMLTLSFILVFIGIGAILTALIGFLVFPFDSGAEQVLVIIVMSGLSAWLFKPMLTKRFGPTPETSVLETLTTGKIGSLIKHDQKLRVFYQGTSYEVINDNNEFQEGDKVRVESIENNQAYIAPIKKLDQ